MNQKPEVMFVTERAISIAWTGRLIILMAGLVGLVVFVYPETLRNLFLCILHREGSSHGLFVPFISGYFFWLRSKTIRHSEPYFSLLPGAIIIFTGFSIFYVSRGSTGVTFPALSLLFVVIGLFIALFGTKIFKEASFPLLFLVTMIPLPQPIYSQIADWMREITTSGSVWLMQLIELPIFREGYNIQLPSTDLSIDIGCSGIRYLVSYLVFSLAYAFLCKRTFKGKLLVVLSAFPIALIAGVLRLSSIYLSVYFIGPFMAGHGPHIVLSWLIFLVVLVATIIVDQSLSRRRQGQRA